jgi:cysteine desulfurase
MALRAYLDWNATTPVLPEVMVAVREALALTGNPSSIHAEGRAARALMEGARKDIARLLNADHDNVFFTSGATEGINAVLSMGLCATCGARGRETSRILACATEHAAIFAAAPAAEVIPVDGNGVLDLAALSAMLATGAAALVAVQIANNETGVVQPIRDIADLVHAHGGALLVDAVQGPGKMPVDIVALGADVLIITAHKFGGPKGIGALVFANGETRLSRPLLSGGGQERGQRQGTENLSGIAGFAAAARKAGDVDFAALLALRDRFEAALKQLCADVFVAGEGTARLPNTSFFALPGLEASKGVIASDLDGVALSSGSACSSGKVKASKVLTAMGAQTRAPNGALRVSLGPTTTWDELEACLFTLSRQMARAGQARVA